VSRQDQPGFVAFRAFDQATYGAEIFAIHSHGHHLGGIEMGGRVRGLIQPASPGLEELGDQRDVALGVGATPDVGLAAGIGKADWANTQQLFDLIIRLQYLSAHPI
jgi:hypothetical protein